MSSKFTRVTFTRDNVTGEEHVQLENEDIPMDEKLWAVRVTMIDVATLICFLALVIWAAEDGSDPATALGMVLGVPIMRAIILVALGRFRIGDVFGVAEGLPGVLSRLESFESETPTLNVECRAWHNSVFNCFMGPVPTFKSTKRARVYPDPNPSSSAPPSNFGVTSRWKDDGTMVTGWVSEGNSNRESRTIARIVHTVAFETRGAAPATLDSSVRFVGFGTVLRMLDHATGGEIVRALEDVWHRDRHFSLSVTLCRDEGALAGMPQKPWVPVVPNGQVPLALSRWGAFLLHGLSAYCFAAPCGAGLEKYAVRETTLVFGMAAGAINHARDPVSGTAVVGSQPPAVVSPRIGWASNSGAGAGAGAVSAMPELMDGPGTSQQRPAYDPQLRQTAPLWYAVATRDIDGLKKILEAGDRDACLARGPGEEPPLHRAVRTGTRTIVRLLLDGLPPAAFDQKQDGLNALHAAVVAGRTGFVAMIVEEQRYPAVQLNAMVFTGPHAGDNAMHMAAKTGNAPAMRSLLESPHFKGYDTPNGAGKTPMEAASPPKVAGEVRGHYVRRVEADRQNTSPGAAAGGPALAVSEMEAVIDLSLALSVAAEKDDAAETRRVLAGGDAGSGPGAQSAVHVAALAAARAGPDGRPPFVVAAQGGCEAVVRAYLDDGAFDAITARSSAGLTALMAAAIEGHAGAIRAIIGSDRYPSEEINAVTKAKESALHLAAESGSADAVTAILDSPRFVLIDERDAAGKTAFELVPDRFKAEVRPAFHRAFVAMTHARAAAAEIPPAPRVRAPVQAAFAATVLASAVGKWTQPPPAAADGGAPAPAPAPVPAPAPAPASLHEAASLHDAAARGDVAALAAALENLSSNPNAVDSDTGLTPAGAAARAGAIETLDLLLGHPGVDPNRTGPSGVTPLIAAARAGEKDAVAALVLSDKFTNVDAADNAGATALHCAAERGDPEIITTVLYSSQCTSSLSHRNKMGLTPVEVARARGHEKAALALHIAGGGDARDTLI